MKKKRKDTISEPELVVSTEEIVEESVENIDSRQTEDTQTGTEQEPSEEKTETDLLYYAMDYAGDPHHNYLSNIQGGYMSKDEFMAIMKEALREKTDDEEKIAKTLKLLERYIWGYYIIEDFLNDDTISDIKIYSEDNIRLKQKGKRHGTDIRFRDRQDYLKFIDNVCTRNKVSLSDINAISIFTDITGNDRARLRFNITGAIINSSSCPVVYIRKILKNKKDLMTLTTAEENHMVPLGLVPYLKKIAKESPGILFIGKGASGKTTLMNALIDEIPFDKSGAVIQESDECFTDKHPDMMFQHIVTSQGEGKINYYLKRLGTNGLLTDLDYYIIGDIQGDEAKTFMDAAYTGHQCWTSCHGQSSTEGMNKLIDYIVRATKYTRKEVITMLTSMKVVIFLKNYAIEEISEIRGIDESGEFIYEKVYDRTCPEKSTIMDWSYTEEAVSNE